MRNGRAPGNETTYTHTHTHTHTQRHNPAAARGSPGIMPGGRGGMPPIMPAHTQTTHSRKETQIQTHETLQHNTKLTKTKKLVGQKLIQHN